MLLVELKVAPDAMNRAIGTESRMTSQVPASPEGTALLLSIREAAEQLGISQHTVRGLVTAGQIEHVRVGSRILISRKALERFIEVNTHAGYGAQRW